MPVRSCRVTIKDMDGVKHTVEVTAETLYEAVALGLAAVRGNDWVMGIAQGMNVVEVSVVDVPIKHCRETPGLQRLARTHRWARPEKFPSVSALKRFSDYRLAVELLGFQNVFMAELPIEMVQNADPGARFCAS